MQAMPWVVTASSFVFLTFVDGLAARAGGAAAMTGAVRVGFWGAFAMALTYGVGRLFAAVVQPAAQRSSLSDFSTTPISPAAPLPGVV